MGPRATPRRHGLRGSRSVREQLLLNDQVHQLFLLLVCTAFRSDARTCSDRCRQALSRVRGTRRDLIGQ
jgi:hypothetical protein